MKDIKGRKVESGRLVMVHVKIFIIHETQYLYKKWKCLKTGM